MVYFRRALSMRVKHFRFENTGNGITTMPKPAANVRQGHLGSRASQGISQFANGVHLHLVQLRFDFGDAFLLRFEIGRVKGKGST